MKAIIVSDSSIVREGVRSLLAGSEVEVVAVASSAAPAAELATAWLPDLAIVGAGILEPNGCQVLSTLRAASPSTSFLIVGRQRDLRLAQESLEQSVGGVLSEDLTRENLILAAQAAIRGFLMIERNLLSAVLPRLSSRQSDATKLDLLRLTPREREVVQLLAEGRTNRDIAVELTVSASTVRTHVANIIGKLGLQDRVQAVLWSSQRTAGADEDAFPYPQTSAARTTSVARKVPLSHGTISPLQEAWPRPTSGAEDQPAER